jgi:putative RNA 2'-phosphotransferase
VTDPVYRCSTHGYATSPTCPACGGDAEQVLAADRRVRLSKFVSGALRHFPDDAGLSLSPGGWVEWPALVAAVTDRYSWAREEHLAAVVTADPKGRFELVDGGDETQIRAAYGHSVPVDLDEGTTGGDPEAIPGRLYHGTSPDSAESILCEGIEPMGRQAVHLSGTVSDAREVGRRHAPDPVVLVVDAAELRADGHRLHRRGRETYTTEFVPPEYVRRLDAHGSHRDDG